MSILSTTVRNEQVAHILAVTGIPFKQTPYTEWSHIHGFDVEEGDEHLTHLDFEGIWTAKQYLALDQLLWDQEIQSFTRAGDTPFPFQELAD